MRTITASLCSLITAAAVLAACAAPTEEETATEDVTSSEVTTLVTEPDALAYLETHGFSFAERFAGIEPGARGDALSGAPRYAALVGAMKRDVLAAAAHYPEHGFRLPAFGDESKTARERVGSSYQELNWTWFGSPAVRWELTGVVNRFDRRVVPARAASCGELRLVYRPAYDGVRESSRLPAGVILVFESPHAPAGCRAVAESWTHAPTGGGADLGRWLEGGPLRGLGQPISFELNALTDLWSRFVREWDGVGRHHQYSLRVFRPEGDGLGEEPLANTPDVTAIVGGPRYDDATSSYVAAPAKPARKAALLRWIADNRAAIESGRANLEPLAVDGEGTVDVRAKQVDAYTAMGLTRAANRPYTRVFGDDLQGFQAAVGLGTRSEANALLRRLDTMTCTGCHVARSVLGLHLVGEERDHAIYKDHAAHAAADEAGSEHLFPTDGEKPGNEPPFIARLVANKLAVGISPHLRDEKDRRAADLRAFLENGGGVPMPPPDRGATLAGTYGATCFLGDEDDPGFGAAKAPEYQCREGLRCVALDDGSFGQCIPRYVDGSGNPDASRRSIGDPIEVQSYRPGSALASVDPFRESGPVETSGACTSGGATGRHRGFPYGGICTPVSGGLIKDGSRACRLGGGESIGLGESAYVSRTGSAVRAPDRPDAPRVVCGAAPFQDNVSRTWGKMSTAAMIWQSCATGLQIACDEDHPCRDEYVCMRTLPDPVAPDPRRGTCMPGYVLAQLEIDAHRVPGTKVPCIEARGKAVVECAP